MTTVEILRKAKQIQSDRGMVKGRFGAEGVGPCCMSGALMEAARDTGLYDEVYGIVLRVIGDWPAISAWNDLPDTTPEMAIDAFDRAIALAEGGTNG